MKINDLEKSGEGGFAVFRIPALAVGADGGIFAAYECRTSRNDWDTRAIGLKISHDGGNTFGERIIIDEDESLAVNNPLLLPLRCGRVLIIYQKDYSRTFIRFTDDGGKSFSPAKEITGAFEGFRDEYDFSVCAVGPGHGIELDRRSAHPGRIIVPVWLANGGGRSHFPSVCASIHSDDGGESWECGDIIHADDEIVSPSETACAELPDGRVLFNIRHCGSSHLRALAISEDGAHFSSRPQLCGSLTDPVCFASMCADEDIIYYSGCENSDARENLTLKYSSGGTEWKRAAYIYGSAGYSDIALSPDRRTVYCFFERDDLAALSFAVISKDELAYD